MERSFYIHMYLLALLHFLGNKHWPSLTSSANLLSDQRSPSQILSSISLLFSAYLTTTSLRSFRMRKSIFLFRFLIFKSVLIFPDTTAVHVIIIPTHFKNFSLLPRFLHLQRRPHLKLKAHSMQVLKSSNPLTIEILLFILLLFYRANFSYQH